MANESDSNDVNDIVVCKIVNGSIVGRWEDDWDDTITLKIIGMKHEVMEVEEFVVYVPEYELARLKTEAKVNSYLSKEFGIDDKFLGDKIAFIRPRHILETSYKADGKWCANCNEFVDKADTNREDGSFVCYSCNENPWR